MFVPKFLQTLQSLPKIRILLISVPQSKISKRVDKKANKSWNKWKSISVLILRAKVRHPNKKGLGRAKGVGTGKSLSEVLILASTTPQHDKRLFIELRVENCKLRTCSEHVVYTNCSSFMFCHSEHSMYTTCSEHVLSLQFSCTELVIQWTIFCHILG